MRQSARCATTLRAFARGNTVVLAQHGVWRSPQSNEVMGEADVASAFRLENHKAVTIARRATLATAGLDKSGEMRASLAA